MGTSRSMTRVVGLAAVLFATTVGTTSAQPAQSGQPAQPPTTQPSQPGAPRQPAPMQRAPGASGQPAPMQPAPGASGQPTPMQPAPMQPAPMQPAPGAPGQPAPMQPAPMQPAPGTPGQPTYGAPGQPTYGTPGQPPYGAPGQPAYGAPRSYGSSPYGANESPPPPPQVNEDDLPSPGVAFGLSLGITAAGIGMMSLAANTNGNSEEALATVGFISFVVGPTTGHIYAGKVWNAGLGIRLVGGGLGVTGLLVALSACPLFSGDCDEGTADAAAAIAITGGVLYLAGGVYEIIEAPRATARRNEARMQAQVVPAVGPDRAGLAVVGSF